MHFRIWVTFSAACKLYAYLCIIQCVFVSAHHLVRTHKCALLHQTSLFEDRIYNLVRISANKYAYFSTILLSHLLLVRLSQCAFLSAHHIVRHHFGHILPSSMRTIQCAKIRIFQCPLMRTNFRVPLQGPDFYHCASFSAHQCQPISAHLQCVPLFEENKPVCNAQTTI